jgi:glycosyltransferase involved in cell wall biosynthesis
MSATELHIAALPFPSYQGTQAAIRSMLEARYAYGKQAELFTYGAAGYAWVPGFALHRGQDDARVGLRSGPSWAKVFADLRMAVRLPGLCRRRAAGVLIAHHVEAMALACRMRTLPRIFFAHTDLAAELPSYAPSRYARILARTGALTDRMLCMQAHAIAAISPALCDALHARTGVRSTYVPTPWPVPAPIHIDERARARHRLGISEQACVALYAGNLDAYQDAEQTLAALERLATRGGPRLCLLLATNSAPERFLARAAQLQVPVHALPLAGEPVRRMLHAAADLAIVPRATPGGMPMKLLDAMARGLPCALAPLAAAGLRLRGRAEQADAPGAVALSDAVARLLSQLSQPERRRELSERARAYIASEHSSERFHAALDRVIADARSNHLGAPRSGVKARKTRIDHAHETHGDTLL